MRDNKQYRCPVAEAVACKCAGRCPCHDKVMGRTDKRKEQIRLSSMPASERYYECMYDDALAQEWDDLARRMDYY